MRASQFVAVGADRRLHGERSVACAHGMVLMGERGAEQCHDAVAHDLIHRAFVTVYRFHHRLENRVDDLARFFRVSVSQQFERALDVGEQHRDLLALALEHSFRRQDFFRQVAGDVTLGGVGRGRLVGSRAYRLSAGEAKARARGQLGATLCATEQQAAPALNAEFRLCGVFLEASRALHQHPPQTHMIAGRKRLRTGSMD